MKLPTAGESGRVRGEPPLAKQLSVHILGISAYYHDSAAALLRDGQIVARIQDRLVGSSPKDLANQEFAQLGRSYRYDAAFAPVDPFQPEPTAFIVKVKVRWNDAGAEQSEAFETILLRKHSPLPYIPPK